MRNCGKGDVRAGGSCAKSMDGGTSDGWNFLASILFACVMQLQMKYS